MLDHIFLSESAVSKWDDNAEYAQKVLSTYLDLFARLS